MIMADISNSQLYKNSTGILQQDAFIVLVKTEWNAAITDALESGAIEALKAEKRIKTASLVVPGAVELAFAIRKHWETCTATNRPDAYIAFGCVVRGDTPHFDYVCQSVTHGITELNLQLPVPVIFGVLTVNTDEQAQERIGGKHGHKGTEAAITAQKMIALSRNLEEGNK